MASVIPNQAWKERQDPTYRARILLVSADARDLSYYATILQKVGCRVRATPSFAEAAQHLESKPYDLILLDQGSSGFEGRKVLATAMEVDPELRVLVLAHTLDHTCYVEAMQSGALDYLEGNLRATEIVALIETFVPRGPSARLTSVDMVKGARPTKARSRNRSQSQGKIGGGYGESTKSLSDALRPQQPGSDSSDSCNVWN